MQLHPFTSVIFNRLEHDGELKLPAGLLDVCDRHYIGNNCKAGQVCGTENQRKHECLQAGKICTAGDHHGAGIGLARRAVH